MKRIISFILTFCMLMSLTAAFAENDNEIENNENIIDTSLLTDENVLYKAIQEKNGFSLFGLGYRDNDEIIADFDVVMGFDMSYSMYEYDINGDKQWIDSFKSISEQAPEDTRYAVLSSNSEGFTDDLDKAISEVQEKEYTGTNDIISILDRTISVFDEESSNRNKVVLVTTHKVDDISALKDKMDELSDYGIIPFVFALALLHFGRPADGGCAPQTALASQTAARRASSKIGKTRTLPSFSRLFPARSLPSRDCSTSSHKFFNNAFLQIVIHSFHRLIPRLRTPYISWVS